MLGVLFQIIYKVLNFIRVQLCYDPLLVKSHTGVNRSNNNQNVIGQVGMEQFPFAMFLQKYQNPNVKSISKFK